MFLIHVFLPQISMAKMKNSACWTCFGKERKKILGVVAGVILIAPIVFGIGVCRIVPLLLLALVPLPEGLNQFRVLILHLLSNGMAPVKKEKMRRIEALEGERKRDDEDVSVAHIKIFFPSTIAIIVCLQKQYNL